MPVWVVVGGLKKACELNGHFGTLGGSLPSCALRPSRSRVPSARDTRFPAPSRSAAGEHRHARRRRRGAAPEPQPAARRDSSPPGAPSARHRGAVGRRDACQRRSSASPREQCRSAAGRSGRSVSVDRRAARPTNLSPRRCHCSAQLTVLSQAPWPQTQLSLTADSSTQVRTHWRVLARKARRQRYFFARSPPE